RSEGPDRRICGSAGRAHAPARPQSDLPPQASVIFRTFAAQYPTPHNCCVRFAAAVAGGPRNTRYRAGASPYPDRTCTGWIRSAYPVAPPNFEAVPADAAEAIDTE